MAVGRALDNKARLNKRICQRNYCTRTTRIRNFISSGAVTDSYRSADSANINRTISRKRRTGTGEES